MNELTRSIYLQAMGTDSYVSRCQLPGAASTRRLAIARRPAHTDAPGISELAATVVRKPVVPSSKIPPSEAATTELPVKQNLAPEFSLIAVSCGGWLWLEELEDSSRLSGQLLLIQSIAEALGILTREASPGITSTQFDWPMHNNRQLDQGEEAARSSVTGFIQRKLDELSCKGLVLLGAGCETRIALEVLDQPQCMRTVSTAQMLHQPLLKRQVWRDLQPLLLQA